MPTFYVDTSALAKRYKEEEGTPFIDTFFDLLEKPENKAATSFLTFLELLAMAKRLRKGRQITQESHDRMVARMLTDLTTHFSISPLNTSIMVESVEVIKKHALKAPDAQQLTTALELRKVLHQLGGKLVFVADDDELHDAATSEGLESLNPREPGAVKKLQRLAGTK